MGIVRLVILGLMLLAWAAASIFLDYGESVERGSLTVHYKEPVAKATADKVADVIAEILKDAPEQDRDAQLVVEDGFLRLRLVAAKEDVTPSAVAAFQAWGRMLLARTAVPIDRPLAVELCNTYLRPHRELVVGGLVNKGTWSVWFKPPITRQQAAAVADVLAGVVAGPDAKRERDAEIVLANEKYRLRFSMTTTVVEPEDVAEVQQWGAAILAAKALPATAPLVIELGTGWFVKHKEIPIPAR